MNLTQEETGGLTRMVMEGELTIYCTAEVRDALAAGIEGTGGLALDMTGVTRCDAAGLQLLVSASKTAAAREKSFVVEAASPSVAELLAEVRIDLAVPAPESESPDASNG